MKGEIGLSGWVVSTMEQQGFCDSYVEREGLGEAVVGQAWTGRVWGGRKRAREGEDEVRRGATT